MGKSGDHDHHTFNKHTAQKQKRARTLRLQQVVATAHGNHPRRAPGGDSTFTGMMSASRGHECAQDGGREGPACVQGDEEDGYGLVFATLHTRDPFVDGLEQIGWRYPYRPVRY